MSLTSFLISDAIAEAGAAAEEPSLLVSLAPMIILFVIFYFLLIRPQQKKTKEHRKLVEALGKGDEVVTAGGILGKIRDVSDDFLEVEIANNVQINIQRHQIVQLMPKGTYKPSSAK